jgi:hypothetical protein
MKKRILFLLILLLACASQAQIITALLTVTNAGVFPDTITINGQTRYFTNTITALNQIPAGIDVPTTVSNIDLYYLLVPQTTVSIAVPNPINNTIQFTAPSGANLTFSNSTFPGWSTSLLGTNNFYGSSYLRGPFANIATSVEKSNTETTIINYLNDTNSTATISPAAPAFQSFQADGTNFYAYPGAGNQTNAITPTNFYYLPANSMATPGVTYTRSLGVVLQPGYDWKRLQIFWNSNSLLDTGAITNWSGPSGLSAVCRVVAVNSTNATYTSYALEQDATYTNGNVQSKNYCSAGALTANNFSNPIPCYLILTDGGPLTGNNQIQVLTDQTILTGLPRLY